MRQRRGARLVVVAICTGLALLLSGALLAAGANASPGTSASTGAAVSPRVVISSDRGSGRAAERRRAFICNKFWKTRTMDAKKVHGFVKRFKKRIRAGKDILTAFSVAAGTSGIGTLPGVAMGIVGKFGGDWLINFVTKKLTKSLKTYKRVGIKVGIKCKWGFAPYPSIGFHGPKR